MATEGGLERRGIQPKDHARENRQAGLSGMFLVPKDHSCLFVLLLVVAILVVEIVCCPVNGGAIQVVQQMEV
jgi:hypothetical protein